MQPGYRPDAVLEEPVTYEAASLLVDTWTTELRHEEVRAGLRLGAAGPASSSGGGAHASREWNGERSPRPATAASRPYAFLTPRCPCPSTPARRPHPRNPSTATPRSRAPARAPPPASRVRGPGERRRHPARLPRAHSAPHPRRPSASSRQALLASQPAAPTAAASPPPCARVVRAGMVWSGFRPSDEPTTYGYNIPANMYAWSALQRARDLNAALWRQPDFEERARRLADSIKQGALGTWCRESGRRRRGGGWKVRYCPRRCAMQPECNAPHWLASVTPRRHREVGRGGAGRAAPVRLRGGRPGQRPGAPACCPPVVALLAPPLGLPPGLLLCLQLSLLCCWCTGL